MTEVFDNVTFSFIKLQRLEMALEDIREGQPVTDGRARTLRRLATELDATAAPMLVRHLGSGHDVVSQWARALLLQIAAPGQLGRDRTRQVIRRGAASPALDALTRRRCRELLAATAPGESAPSAPRDEHTTAATRAARDDSLRQLAGCLDTRAEVARAADLLLRQLDDEELLSFVDAFADGAPRRAATLLEELSLRDDIDGRLRSELRRLAAPLGATHPPAVVATRPTVRVGHHPDGRTVIVASVQRDTQRPPRHRCLCAVIDPAGVLTQARYDAELSGSALQRQVIGGLGRQGVRLTRSARQRARDQIIAAARAAICRGAPIPSDFYLGRDVLGIHAEHWPGHRDHRATTAALLARAIDLLSVHDHARARPILERYVAIVPDDADGVANLGVCALALEEHAAACEHLERAVALDPNEPLHHWNLAAAAHRAGRAERCSQALRDYLALIDDDATAGGAERAASARVFLAEHARLARLAHCDA